MFGIGLSEKKYFNRKKNIYFEAIQNGGKSN